MASSSASVVGNAPSISEQRLKRSSRTRALRPSRQERARLPLVPGLLSSWTKRRGPQWSSDSGAHAIILTAIEVELLVPQGTARSESSESTASILTSRCPSALTLSSTALGSQLVVPHSDLRWMSEKDMSERHPSSHTPCKRPTG